ncbi:MAG: metallophosphoesterase [Nanoarchaeota archaeon]
MKFLVLGDLHGRKPKLKNGFDAIISPGDFADNFTRKYKFKAVRLSKKQNKNVSWTDLVGKRKAELLSRKEDKSGREVMEHLNSLNKKVYFVPGNYEPEMPKLRNINKRLKNLVNCHMRLVTLKDYCIIGYGYSSYPEIPQHEQDRHRYKDYIPQMKKDYIYAISKLSRLFLKAKKPVIFITHNPPFNTALDIVYWKGSPRYGEHLGSVVAKEMIEAFKPIVCCSGHMHEHLACCKMKGTLCINPGKNIRKKIILDLEGTKAKANLTPCPKS